MSFVLGLSLQSQNALNKLAGDDDMLIDNVDSSASPDKDDVGADVLPDPLQSAESFIIEVGDLLKPQRSRYPVQ